MEPAWPLRGPAEASDVARLRATTIRNRRSLNFILPVFPFLSVIRGGQILATNPDAPRSEIDPWLQVRFGGACGSVHDRERLGHSPSANNRVCTPWLTRRA